MRMGLSVSFILLFCMTAPFAKVASAASKIRVDEIKAVACVFENKDTGEQEEIDRIIFPGVGGMWVLDDKCKKAAHEHAKQKGLSDWRYLCCPISADDKVHCETPFGSHGKW